MAAESPLKCTPTLPPTPENSAADEDAVKARQAHRHALRRTLLERRMALSPDEHTKLSTMLLAHLRSGFPQLAGMRVGFCWPINGEPDVRPLLATWRAQAQPGFCALLAGVVEKNMPLAFRAWSPETSLVPDCHGIPMPATGESLQPEALLLPVNAFDAAAYRLGYGGGYFDRTLAALNQQAVRPLTIGLGFELARVDSIHPEPHDLPLTAIVTEAGVFSKNLFKVSESVRSCWDEKELAERHKTRTIREDQAIAGERAQEDGPT